jgi:ribosome-associated protein
MEPNRLRITPALSIPWGELQFVATRAGGPGGQHVNTSSTRVELRWDLVASPSLTLAQREQLQRRLAGRLDRRGRLRLVSGASRSQYQNREAVTERFQRLLAQALRVPKPRKATKPTLASKERRLTEKRLRARRKQQRRPPAEE